MSFTNPYAAKTDATTTITATETNTAGLYISRAIDGTNGGNYTPGTVIGIGGSGLKLLSTLNLQLASRSVVRHQSMVAFTVSGNWALDTSPLGAWKNTGSGGVLWIMLDRLPHGQVLDTVTVRFKGQAGAHAADLANIVKPTIRAYYVDSSGAENALAAATSDPSTTSAGYEAAHDITTGSLAHTVDLTAYRYALKVTGETGAGFTANAQVLTCKVSCTITGYTEY